MLRDFVLELVSAPGAGTTITLPGSAPAGRLTWASKFVTSQTVFYVLDDSTQMEWGIGTLTVGAPSTIARPTAVLGNSAGTLVKLNFAGTTRCYNALPSSYTVYNNDQWAGFRNYLINGGMDVWQRGTSFGSVIAGAYSVDRWTTGFDGSGATTNISQQPTLAQVQVDAGLQYATSYNVSTAGSGGTNRWFGQKIQSARTLGGKTVTLSAWVKADTSRTIQAGLQQMFGTGGSPSTAVSTALVNWAVTNTVQRFQATWTLPTTAGKTFGTNNDHVLYALFYMPVNTVLTVEFSGVQLEPGPVMSQFEYRPLSVETPMCQRFYLPIVGYQAYGYGGTSGLYTATPVSFDSMRVAPTVAVSSTTYSNCSALNVVSASNNMLQASVNVTATGNWVVTANLALNAEL